MNLPGLILDAGAQPARTLGAAVADATHDHEGRVLPTARHQPAAAAVAANVLSSVVKRGDHRRRSFELLAKPSVLVRSGGDASAQRLGLAAPSAAYPIPAEWFSRGGRWRPNVREDSVRPRSRPLTHRSRERNRL